MVWVIAFGELFFGDLWCVVWGYGGMRTHFSLLNPALRGGAARSFTCGQGSVTYRWFLVACRWFCTTYARAVGATCALVDALFTCGQAIANRKVNYASIRQRTSSLASATRSNRHQPGPADRLATSLSRHGRTSNTPAQPLPERIRLAWPCTWSIGASAPRRFRPAPPRAASHTGGHFPILNSCNRLRPRLPSPYFDRSLDGRPSSRSP